MVFSNPEIEYMKSQRLARFATVSPKGQPEVVPVAFEFDGKYIYIGSHSQGIFLHTRKYKSVRAGNKLVGLAIDDLVHRPLETARHQDSWYSGDRGT